MFEEKRKKTERKEPQHDSDPDDSISMVGDDEPSWYNQTLPLTSAVSLLSSRFELTTIFIDHPSISCKAQVVLNAKKEAVLTEILEATSNMVIGRFNISHPESMDR